MSKVTRFDLEQNIMSCWSVIEDLESREFVNSADAEYINAIRTLYSHKFEKLFETFTTVMRERSI